MDRLISWGRNGIEALHGLSLLQLCLIGALGLGLGYWALGASVRFIQRAALFVLLLIAAVALVRLCSPETFCAVHWPSPLGALCSR